ncbi:MAG: hypothetical protein Q8O03_04465 [Nanoarchaeota archaeon]|nr:hypothetical protein [Nanoarchaeota archaeon]
MIKIMNLLEEVAIYLAMIVIGVLVTGVIVGIFKIYDTKTVYTILIISVLVMILLQVIDRFSKNKS